MRFALVFALIFALVSLLGCSRRHDDPLVAAAKDNTAELSHPTPIFRVRDLAASQRYYRDALGFKLAWEDGEPANFGAVTRADATFFLCHDCQGHAGAWSFVFAHDVDALHADFTRRAARVVMPPTNMPWGLREMQVADLDGNIVRFASAIEH